MEQVAIWERYKWVLLGALGVLLVIVFSYIALTPPEPVTIAIQPPLPTATHTTTPTPTLTPTFAPLEVYVTGAVANPESRHALPAGSRVEDAIAAAGGATEDADLSLVNLAQRLQDGDQVHVPTRTSGNPASPISTPTPNAPRPIDLNTASVDELEALPGIGPATAQDIVDYRVANGFFLSVDELDNVSGIGASTLEQLRLLVMVDPLVLATLAPELTAEPTAALINLNTATVEELDTLPGVGEATAQNIIAHRESIGGFTSVEQLLDVPGIGEATLEQLRPLVIVK